MTYFLLTEITYKVNLQASSGQKWSAQYRVLSPDKTCEFFQKREPTRGSLWFWTPLAGQVQASTLFQPRGDLIRGKIRPLDWLIIIAKMSKHRLEFRCPNPDCDWKIFYNARRKIRDACPICGRSFAPMETAEAKQFQVESRLDRRATR